jgi:hypothetical protein
MSWKNQLQDDPLPWLLEPEDPGVRYLALRDLLDRPPDDSELREARRLAHTRGPIATILAQMRPEGYWVKPGPGYNPKYRSTVWALIALAELGASAAQDARVATACAYLLEQMAPGGQFSALSSGSPSGTVDCLQGNLCWSLLELGYDDPRLKTAFEWLARTVTGEGIAPASERDALVRYYAYKCGPGFACSANDRLPCAWGATKVMLALGRWPARSRTPLMRRALAQGVEFLFSVDPATAAYPTPGPRTPGQAAWKSVGLAAAAPPTSGGRPPNRAWWKFGFPVFYVTDLLQVVEALAALGYARDPRLAGALDIVREKQDEHGRWPLEYDYAGKAWFDAGPKRQPNKWVTLRALRVLKAAGYSG